jgi:hypothetical protein
MITTLAIQNHMAEALKELQVISVKYMDMERASIIDRERIKSLEKELDLANDIIDNHMGKVSNG